MCSTVQFLCPALNETGRMTVDSSGRHTCRRMCNIFYNSCVFVYLNQVIHVYKMPSRVLFLSLFIIWFYNPPSTVTWNCYQFSPAGESSRALTRVSIQVICCCLCPLWLHKSCPESIYDKNSE